ncbi:hypothetical protein EV192_113156 [Actinocrispum wychmicini]|uniref:Uncharacterized protein n=1 Tax=Actinocrispum wychmicini TaxID=1213861 RepID=A0A4R2J1Q7_9PSEU|nr:hypothetical protein EV192_113156 [Actinocrispum wychmicini]
MHPGGGSGRDNGVFLFPAHLPVGRVVCGPVLVPRARVAPITNE